MKNKKDVSADTFNSLSDYFSGTNEMAIKPSTIPISKPIFTLLIKSPMTRPNKIATTPAIFLRVMSAC